MKTNTNTNTNEWFEIKHKKYPTKYKDNDTFIYNKLKKALESNDSILYIKYMNLYNMSINQIQYVSKIDDILSIQFHYEFSHGNYENVKNILKKMDKLSVSYERHYLKFLVLEWWIFDYNQDNRNWDIVLEKYNLIMNKIYALLDKHRHLEKKNKNAYQMIRDHIFYYKMGLFQNSIDVMDMKCKKWFKKCDLEPQFYTKLLKRIEYIHQEYRMHNKVFLGIKWDNVDTKQNENIVYFIPSAH